MKTRLQFLIATIAAVTLAATAWAGEVPDSARASRLQALSDAAWRLQVKVPHKTYRMVRPSIGLEGITPTEPGRAPIPWERIESVETQTHARGRGFAGGAVLGALAGAFAVAVVFDRGQEWGAATFVLAPITLGVGGLIGGTVGVKTAANSERIYP